MLKQPRAGLSENNKRSLEKMFPNLIKEIEGEVSKVNIDSVWVDAEKTEDDTTDKLRNYKPTVVDFIRRCDTEYQAECVFSFLEKRGELTHEQSEQLRKQLKKEGVRSFGSKKEDDYYFKQGGFC
jgi:hypothetical protein